MSKRGAKPQKLEAVGAPTEPVTTEASKSGPIVWSYPNRSRCPRCGGIDTEAYASVDGVQYRRCRSAACRNRYKVNGNVV
jgi:hypothetical protein